MSKDDRIASLEMALLWCVRLVEGELHGGLTLDDGGLQQLNNAAKLIDYELSVGPDFGSQQDQKG